MTSMAMEFWVMGSLWQPQRLRILYTFLMLSSLDSKNAHSHILYVTATWVLGGYSFFPACDVPGQENNQEQKSRLHMSMYYCRMQNDLNSCLIMLSMSFSKFLPLNFDSPRFFFVGT